MIRFCGACGTQSEAAERFCSGCGKPLPPVAAAPQQQPAWTPPAAAAPPQQSAWNPPAAAAPPQQQPVWNQPAAAAPAPPQPAWNPPPPPRPAWSGPPSAPAPAPQPETEWHYASGGSTQGPVPESRLRNLLRSLPPGTMVWRPGLAAWQTAEAAGLAVPAPPSFQAAPGFQAAAAAPAAAYAPAPAYAAPAAAPVPGQPVPPAMHWVVLLVLAWVTGGLAGLVWAYKEAFFVQKIDRASKAVMLLTVSLAAMVAQVVLVLAAMTSRSASGMAAVGGLTMLLNLVVMVVWLVCVFSMRSSIERHYNSVEPIGLKLSGVMTFFFSILYFQYHFSRIAEWKKTGRLG